MSAMSRRHTTVALTVTALAVGVAAGLAPIPVHRAVAATASAGVARALAPGLVKKPGSSGTVDTGTMSAITELTGAQDAWAAGVTGAGVDVAVIDTGVTPVPGLDAPDKVVVGPDLSFEAPGASVTGLDANGHGTFMAGVIAGRDVGADLDDPDAFVGMAPDSRIIDVKVGAADGAADVTQVIAAVDWVTQHAHDPGLNIRVLSLSFGTEADQDYDVDPLAQAVEQAWAHGIIVVAAAGNDGKPTRDLANPAADPYLLAAGADDPNGTMDPSDDRVPDFAQHGTVARPVDVIAPGMHVLGLRVPGSYLDTRPSNAGQEGERYQRGSGTSQAAAVVSGAAALLAQAHPDASPDTIKALLTDTATPVLRGSGRPSAPGQRLYSGHGLIDLAAALAAAPEDRPQTWPASTGTGTLDGARGGALVSTDGVDLVGQQDIFGRPFDSVAQAEAQVRATAWSGGTWNGTVWSGAGWGPAGWAAGPWADPTWAGTTWPTTIGTELQWTGSQWTGSHWTGSHWTGSHWTGSHWTGSHWSSANWS